MYTVQSEDHLASWLRQDSILLHIGVHKTGTTALQAALVQAGDAVRTAGILHLAPESHFGVAMAALGRKTGWDPSAKVPARSQWNEVAREATRHRGRAIFSDEMLCEASDDAAAMIIRDLGVSRVQVLVTLRPLEEILPSTWQQYLKSGYGQPYEDWLRSVLSSRGVKTTRSFWRRNDYGRLVELWGSLVGPEDVGILVVDSRNRSGLFRDVEALLGLPTGALQESGQLQHNRSLSAAEAEVLRMFNVRMRKSMSYVDYHRLIRRGAALALVEGRCPGSGEPVISTPEWAVLKAREFQEDSVKRIQRSGSPVFGRFELLGPDREPLNPAQAAAIEEVPVGIAPLLLEGAVRASVGMSFVSDAGSRQLGSLSMVPGRTLVSELWRRATNRLKGLVK